MSRGVETGDVRLGAIRVVLAKMGYSGAAIEGAAAALDGDGLVPLFRAMAVCRVSRNTVRGFAARYGIVLLKRSGRLGSLVYLPGIKAAVNGCSRIPRGDGSFADGAVKEGRAV